MSSRAHFNSAVANRYALALFELAQDKKAVDKVSNSLASLSKAIADSAELQAVLASPVVSVANISNALAAILKGIAADPLTKNLVMLMAQKRRSAYIAATAHAYAEMVATSKGEVTANITVAAPLTPEQEQELGTMLAKRLKKIVRPHITVDASLIGGLIVQVGSQMIDASIKTKLSSLQLSLKGA